MSKYLLIVSLILGGCTSSPPPPPKPRPVDPVRLLKADIRQIAHARPSGSEGNRQVADYLTVELRKLGFAVSRQPFDRGTNIVAVQKGRSPKTIIVGSHFDTYGSAPGADDNGSGCAVNLAVARALSKQKPNHTLRYLFFDCEEQGLVGSTYYATNMKESAVFMVNLDMVGRLNQHTGQHTGDLDSIFTGLFRKYPWAKAISFRAGSGPSDQTPFQQRGIPAVWVFTGTHGDYHQTTDIPERLDYVGMNRIRQYVQDMVLSLDRHLDVTFLKSLPQHPYRP